MNALFQLKERGCEAEIIQTRSEVVQISKPSLIVVLHGAIETGDVVPSPDRVEADVAMNREVTNGVISDHLAKDHWPGNSRRNQEPNCIWVDSTHLISEESDERRIGLALKIRL
jgi:hypothetical protein